MTYQKECVLRELYIQYINNEHSKEIANLHDWMTLKRSLLLADRLHRIRTGSNLLSRIAKRVVINMY